MYSGSFSFRKPRRSLTVGRRLSLSDHIGHQPLLSRSVFLGQNDSFSDGRMLAKRCLDLSELDSEPADLDLVVNPAQKFDVPIGQVTGRDRRSYTVVLPARC